MEYSGQIDYDVIDFMYFKNKPTAQKRSRFSFCKGIIYFLYVLLR